MWRGSSHHRDLAGRFDTHRCAFPTARRHRLRWAKGTDLHVSGNADPHQSAFFPRLLLLGAQLRIANDLLGLVERRFIVAAVVVQAGRSVKGKLTCGREILPPHFRWIHSQVESDQIKRPLDYISGFRSARTTISVGGHLVCETGRDVDLDRGYFVRTGKHQARQGWYCRR